MTIHISCEPLNECINLCYTEAYTQSVLKTQKYLHFNKKKMLQQILKHFWIHTKPHYCLKTWLNHITCMQPKWQVVEDEWLLNSRHTQGMQSLPHQHSLHTYSYKQDDCKVSNHIAWTSFNVLKTHNGIPLSSSSSSNIDCNVEHSILITFVAQTWKPVWPNIYVMTVLL
jgi:hypothetical protein